MNVYDYVILGGGIAGLCAAKRLLELGVQPLIIEAGSYPAHKVCGEFISPSSLPILNQWNIHPVSISRMQLNTPLKNLELIFPRPAGSLSHLTFDLQLAKQVSQQGALLYTQTKVLSFAPPTHEGKYHTLSLSSGETIKAKHLFIAAGRLPGFPAKKPPIRYMGLKAHFSNLNLDSTLHMFSFKGAYLGLAPVENGYANLACLATIEAMQHFSSPQHFMQNILASHPLLCNLLASGSNLFGSWMEASIPEFGMRSTPNWPHTYWIGDAAGTIPPACGNGLSLAIASGYLAAEFAIENRPLAFKHAWQKRCASQMRIAKGLHQLFLRPSWGSKALSINHYFPWVARQIFESSRDPGLLQ